MKIVIFHSSLLSRMIRDDFHSFRVYKSEFLFSSTHQVSDDDDDVTLTGELMRLIFLSFLERFSTSAWALKRYILIQCNLIAVPEKHWENDRARASSSCFSLCIQNFSCQQHTTFSRCNQTTHSSIDSHCTQQNYMLFCVNVMMNFSRRDDCERELDRGKFFSTVGNIFALSRTQFSIKKSFAHAIFINSIITVVGGHTKDTFCQNWNTLSLASSLKFFITLTFLCFKS